MIQPPYNEIDKIIEEVISFFLFNLDLNVYYNVAPYLCEDVIFDPTCQDYKIKSTMKDISKSPYFPNNHITTDEVTNLEDLRTVAHLSRFFKNRVAYNPKNIDRYLWSIGKMPYSETAFDIVCYNVCDCTNISKDIGYREWLKLEDGRTPPDVTLTEKACLEQDYYIESFDTPEEYNEKDTPIR